MYYCNPSESKKYLLDTFTFKPQEFKHQDLVDQLENISLLTEEPSSSKAAKKWISLVSFSFLFFTHSMLNIRKWKKYIEMLPKKCKKTLFAPERRQWKPKMNLNLFHKLINTLLTTMSTRLNWSYWSSPLVKTRTKKNTTLRLGPPQKRYELQALKNNDCWLASVVHMTWVTHDYSCGV